MEKYIDPLTATSELVLVSNSTSQMQNGSSLIWGWISGSDPVHWNTATGWICEKVDPVNDFYCKIDWTTKYIDHWMVREGFINHCLIGQEGNNANRCDFNLSTDVMCIVSLFTLTGSLLIAWTARKHRQPTLVTVGDAAAEFLKKQDGTTARDPTSTSRTSTSQNVAILGVRRWQEKRRSPSTECREAHGIHFPLCAKSWRDPHGIHFLKWMPWALFFYRSIRSWHESYRAD